MTPMSYGGFFRVFYLTGLTISLWTNAYRDKKNSHFCQKKLYNNENVLTPEIPPVATTICTISHLSYMFV